MDDNPPFLAPQKICGAEIGLAIPRLEKTAMQVPAYISERRSSWLDVAATWLIAAFVLGLVSLSGSVFGYRSQYVGKAEPPCLTSVAQVHDGFKQGSDDPVYRVHAQVTAPLSAR